jgi:DNA polymerase I
MKIIETHTLDPASIPPTERDWVYNGLDCCITAEVLEKLLPQLDYHTSATYDFSRKLQGPALEMRLRGVKIDKFRKGEVIEEYYRKIDLLERNLEKLALEGVGMDHFNWRSNDDLKELFYDRLAIPAIKRQGRVTVNRDALERLESYLIAKPIVTHIKAMRDLGKKISMLKTEIDPDGRMRTSYNIGGTTTGRFSSSFSEFGTGTNLQNIEESLRSVFVSDQGMKMAYCDTQQGESRVVGAIEWNLFQDDKYLTACESGDLHTTVSMLCEPKKFPWTNDLQKNRELAEQPYYRHYDLRKLCKSIGHGTNYKGGPKTLNYQYKVPIPAIEDFQSKYFKAFPAHQRWHQHVEYTLRSTGHLVSLMGRKRWFFGRRDDDATLREAIAYDPQGSLSDILNNGLLNVWRHRDAELLMQIHDAILIQYPEDEEDEIIPKVMEQLKYPIQLKHNREFLIPYDCKVGWNWGKYDAQKNPDGLKAYIQGDKRKRTEEVSILDREFY